VSLHLLEKNIVVGPFQCNCRLLACPRTGHAVLIDPGDEAEEILAVLKDARVPSGAPLKIQYLFHTHAHLDHIGATRAVKQSLIRLGEKPVIALHKGDEFIYQQLKMQGQLFGMTYDDPLPIDHFFKDQEQIQVGDLKFSVIHTPGHSPGGVCLRLHEDSATGTHETVYSGDTLFQRSIGRTDLWGGDTEVLLQSIRERLFILDGDTRVCPGHGPDTRIGEEKRENPFLS
jgi:hydroxyacylglutathione hydrolase